MAKVLVIGSGGREHAIAWKFAQSKEVDQVFVAPGNPGMRDVATVVDLSVSDFAGLKEFAKKEAVDLTFVGPEIPLCEGIVDVFEEDGLPIFGPSRSAAQLEGSKVFAKDMMKKYNIPTAAYESFSDYASAEEYLAKQAMPIVLKADGLAAGKGVIIAKTYDEAKKALKEMMCNHLFDEAGSSVVIEEYLEGEEFSQFALVNEELVIPMEIAQDHKRAFDFDEGPNTGGMGAYTPVNHLPKEASQQAIEKIIKPIAKAMVKEGIPFRGLLYGGCMWTKDGVKTIEFNVRFGDPETEVLLISMQDDLYDVIKKVMRGEAVTLHWSDRPVLGVVLANKGYPGSYAKGALIEGLDQCDATVFHMGTGEKDGKTTAVGGRVLFVAQSGKDLREAKEKVYHEIEKIRCDTLFCRHDIGDKGIR